MVLKYVGLIILLIVVYSIGFVYGSLKAKKQGKDKYVQATEAMLKAQGDSEASIKATMDVIKAQKQDELGAENREYLAIWLPTILVIINIFVTIFLDLRK